MNMDFCDEVSDFCDIQSIPVRQTLLISEGSGNPRCSLNVRPVYSVR